MLDIALRPDMMIALLLSALATPKALTAFEPRFIRENLVSSWDHTSLQRLDSRIAPDVGLLSATPLDGAVGRVWNVSFSDGIAGVFHVPPSPSEDIEELPLHLWGMEGALSAGEMEHMLVSEGGALRFPYEALMGGIGADEQAPTRSDEQLGAGRASLPMPTVIARKRLLESVHTYGMAIVHGAPALPDAGKVLADALVGAVETTAFGYKFVIRKVGEPHNLAFHSIALQQHTDFTYLKKVPDIAIFSCIQNAEQGGDSLWADGFALAEHLRKVDPAAFDILARTPVRFVDLTDKWDMRATHPTFELAADGHTLERVHFNERTRDSWRQWRPNTTDGQTTATSSEFYRALRKLEVLVDAAEYHVNTPLQPGDIALFDNRRVMHSRTQFVGERWMEGSYISWDSAYATWRALKWQAGEAYEYCGIRVGLESV